MTALTLFDNVLCSKYIISLLIHERQLLIYNIYTDTHIFCKHFLKDFQKFPKTVLFEQCITYPSKTNPTYSLGRFLKQMIPS